MQAAADRPDASNAQPMCLSGLRRGQIAVVIAVHHPLTAVRQKYIARGIVPGARIKVLRGGDPIVVAIEDSRWAVDGGESAHIEVALVEEAAHGWWQRAKRSLRGRGGGS